MLRGIRTVAISVAICTAIGAVFGVLIGAMIGDRPFGGVISAFSSRDLRQALLDPSLIATVLLAFLGGNFGLALGYGFLPESEADVPGAKVEAA
jgi:ABC-type dipeptide/oligopeptide/nickel transport system permease subunit